MKTHVLTSVLVTLCCVGNVAAQQSVTYSQSHGPLPTPFDASATLPLFDANLGTLTSVTITTDDWIETAATVTAVTPANGSASISGHFQLFSPHPALSGLVSPSYDLPTLFSDPTYSVFLADTSFELAPGEDAAFNGEETTSFSLDSSTHTQLLGLQQAGGGSFSLGCAAIGVITTNLISGNVNSAQTTEARCSYSVTYHYEPTAQVTAIPTLSQWTVVALGGLIALLGAGRRRQA